MSHPLLSVIILARNESRELAPFLTNLAHVVEIAEKQHGVIEVVIVDDGRRDGTDAVASEHLPLFARSQLVRLPWACGSRTAVAAGISAARGENVVVLSGTGPVDAAYLTGLLGLLENADAVLCRPAAPAGRLRTGRPVDAGRGWLAERLGLAGRDRSVFVAFRAAVAADLFLCSRSAGLEYDRATRIVCDALQLRLAYVRSAAVPAPNPVAPEGAGGPVADEASLAVTIDLTQVAQQPAYDALPTLADQPGVVM